MSEIMSIIDEEMPAIIKGFIDKEPKSIIIAY